MISKCRPHELLWNIFSRNSDVILYGATVEAQYLVRQFNDVITGIVDRAIQPQTLWHGIECLSASDIIRNTVVINCVTCGHSIEVESFLKEKSDCVINFFDFVALLMPKPQFEYDGISPIFAEWSKFSTLYSRHASSFKDIEKLFCDI